MSNTRPGNIVVGSLYQRYYMYGLVPYISQFRDLLNCSCILEIRKVKEKQKEVSAGGETPDLVRDCNELALAEEILSE